MAVYADRHGERILNKVPFRMEVQKDGSLLLTDRQDRTWRVLGRAVGDPLDPTFEDWGTF